MQKEKNTSRIRALDTTNSRMAWLLHQNVLVRSTLLWLAMMIVLQAVFYLALHNHPRAWQNVAVAQPERGWSLLARALFNNGFILAAIAGGNLFVRFGSVTPGLLILAIQAVSIGWVAGANGFAVPFPSVAAAHATFLRVGLWETSSYAIMCAVTLPKSLLVSATFPAREWTDRRSLSDVRCTPPESVLLALSLTMLVGAAIVEAFV